MDETTFLGWIIKHLLPVFIPVASLVGWVWKKQDSRIDRIEGAMYSKDDAKERREYVDEALEARRQDVRELHSKIDARAERLDDKVDKMNHDMHEGFKEITTLIMGMKK